MNTIKNNTKEKVKQIKKEGEMRKGILEKGRNRSEAYTIIESGEIVFVVKWNDERVNGSKTMARKVAAKWAIENGYGYLGWEYDGKEIDYLPIFNENLEAYPGFKPNQKRGK